ncbi:MAG: ABC transporter ATP-binding protein/permease [Candidatus Omnitrophica bacterium]|nr:ABC transporter ATP-binding protein/permease [Candidatus Omnitrophota bacterium]
MKSYLRLLRFIRPYRLMLGLAVVCMIASALFDVAQLSMVVPLADKVLTDKKIVVPKQLPKGLAGFVDSINNTEPLRLLYLMAVVVVVLFILKGVFNFIQSYLMSDIGQRVVRDVRSKLYRKLQDLSLDYFTRKRSGELISRITNDVKLIENAASYGFTDLVYQSFQVAMFTFLIFYIHWKLALVSLVILPLVSIPIILVGKVLKRLSIRSQEKMADINSLLVETISGVRIVKAFSMEEAETNKFMTHNQGYYRITMKSIKRMLVLSPLTEIIGVFGGIFVFVWAGKEVIAGELSFGVFSLFLGSLLSMIRPFKKLSGVHSLNQQAIAASNRVYEVFDTKATVSEKEGAITLPPVKKNIIFDSVSFKYEDNDVLNNINLEVNVGEVLAIVGPSGVGKSSLVDLIPRFYDPVKGTILIDGVDIKEATLSSLRGQMGLVTQETILFNDSVKANIAYGNTNAAFEAIVKAAKKAGAHDFIMNMPSGYDTFIGDRGYRLSGGERQRLAIARAILKNPPILILDEATSQLDSASEKVVQEAINELIAGRTVFVVAHRLSTIRGADKIIVLEKGRIEEMGTHQQLIAKGGLYKLLHDMQQTLPEEGIG